MTLSNYGPFDKAVYEVLEELEHEELVETTQVYNWREYRLTGKGQEIGGRLLAKLPSRAQDYIRRVSIFVRRLTFTQLVTAIYEAYPEMRANSVFQR